MEFFQIPSGVKHLPFKQLYRRPDKEVFGHPPARGVEAALPSEPRLGGHSQTVAAAGSGGADVPLDIGFIFSNPGYGSYLALAARYRYGVGRSGISVQYHGEPSRGRLPWSNLRGGADETFAADELDP